MLGYLGGDAFTDNPHWRTCFCFYYHFGGEGSDWRARTGDENRKAKAQRIAEGRAHGVLAYAGEQVVGWVHAGPLDELDAFADQAEPGTGAVVCYVVHPRHRRQGIAGRLLDEACAMLADLGLERVDAWPLRELPPDDRLPTTALIYHGTRAMYERAGFEVVEEPAAGPFLHVRRTLTR